MDTDDDDADDIMLILLQIKTTEDLAERLRNHTADLESALSAAAGVEVVPSSAAGLKAIDPLSLSVLLAVAAKSATGAVAALVAKEIYAWVRQLGSQMMKDDRPSEVVMTIGTVQGVSISLIGTDEDVRNAEKKITEALEKSALSSSSKT